MDFDFTDDQVALRDAVARWAERALPFARRHQIAREGGRTLALWQELAELGLTGLAVPEEEAGMGLGPVDAMVVMEEFGRALVPVPYAEAALMAPRLLLAAGSDAMAAWGPRIATGEALIVPAWQERQARHDWANVTTTVQGDGDTARVTGHKSLVAAADEAHAFLVTVRGPAVGTVGLARVDAHAPGVTVTAYPTQDGARAGEVRFDGAPATLLLADATEAFSHAIDIGIAAACAEGVGLMDRMTALTVEYMNTRRQFGQPLAAFQALRHRIADVKMNLELGRSMSYFATLKLTAREDERRRALSQAKVQLGRSMRFVGQQCVQLHGGIAVTDEYVGSHVFKRLTMLDLAFGDTMHHLGEVQRRMTDEAGVTA